MQRLSQEDTANNDTTIPSQDWRETLNATCNRLSTQYLNLLRSASSVMALESSSGKMDPRSGGGGNMQTIQDPPRPALAADIASSSLQCQLAVENIAVAASQLLSLIRTLRLSILLMDEETIQAEEEWQVVQLQESTRQALEQAQEWEQTWMALRNNNNDDSKG
ncbi:RNA polymerase II transcription mediator complex protein [Nitzschia inconspicua]|uniref:RNA polymerase II transcription mediator complex protein n=1 Tax=Nitzschia inconspicua TaxID=303405 RepID=A0A9K3KSN5_9STRA|nr:RNA polymerase II transcription mediator complex protein [Nitzschia inconspicua]